MRDDNGNAMGSFLGGFVVSYAASRFVTEMINKKEQEKQEAAQAQSSSRVRVSRGGTVNSAKRRVNPDNLVLHSEKEIERIEKREDEIIREQEAKKTNDKDKASTSTPSKPQITGACAKYMTGPGPTLETYADEETMAFINSFL